MHRRVGVLGEKEHHTIMPYADTRCAYESKVQMNQKTKSQQHIPSRRRASYSWSGLSTGIISVARHDGNQLTSFPAPI